MPSGGGHVASVLDSIGSFEASPEKRIGVIDIDIDMFVNCNWVDTRWQQYSIHLCINSTYNNTINKFGWKAFWDSNPELSN